MSQAGSILSKANGKFDALLQANPLLAKDASLQSLLKDYQAAESLLSNDHNSKSGGVETDAKEADLKDVNVGSLLDEIDRETSQQNSQNSNRNYTKRLLDLKSIKGGCSIMVSDLSGMTTLTRAYGNIHVASVIVRMNQLMKPLFYKYCNVIELELEADDFVVACRTTKDAMIAACLMKVVCEYYNTKIIPQWGQGHYRIKLGGIGLDCGKFLNIDPNCEKIYGLARRTAFHLGEDYANDGNIVCSNKYKKQFLNENKDDAEVSDFKFDEIKDDIMIDQELGYKIKASVINGDFVKYLQGECEWIKFPPSKLIVDVLDTSYFLKNKQIVKLSERYDFNKNTMDTKDKKCDFIVELDESIKKTFTKVNQTAVMFELEICPKHQHEKNRYEIL